MCYIRVVTISLLYGTFDFLQHSLEVQYEAVDTPITVVQKANRVVSDEA